MKLVSTKGKAEPVSFGEAALQGLAPDGGLYVPVNWEGLSNSFIENISQKSLDEIGYEVGRLFIDEVDNSTLESIVDEALSFDVPLVKLKDGVYVLELFHGPTLAFKDFGARFMSRLFSALREKSDRDLIILAATSGDTGSAVAHGFLGVEGVKVCLLYPSGKVSYIQEQQLTTAGQNVKALEVDGTFDDCQNMVKQAFSDAELNDKLLLSSANSINIARLIPQMFYYFYALAQLPEGTAPIFSVPSGNFGNLTAGLMAHKTGMPASGFIAATNANDVVPAYLKTGKFDPQPSQSTISNAMDVGDPSNFERILYLFEDDHRKVKKAMWGTSFSDAATKRAIRQVYESLGYLMDPHTAIGYLAVQEYAESENSYFNESASVPYVILSTAHPAKFGDVIEPVIGEEIEIPGRLKDCLDKEKQSVAMNNEYPELKNWLLNQFK